MPMIGGTLGRYFGMRFLNAVLLVFCGIFALVALMIGAGRLRSMPAGRLAVWNACVILNVLGAGLGRFGDSWRKLSQVD